ncbi:MAG: CcmD family protein [Ignavibacteriaceae bacterium]|nr:CcmD family protein [Ignavibacterium sp.]MCC6253700.1 CcmD family protein [Ignavibacteriaceae bacterium]HMN24936.1 CcmD family protein [Ignavibacteriaceae bacterium]HRN25415.1 CcmD family protein [Ignavibacteriaceae bacterium]HRP91569.1 CcmD family protein [Ignavibacteriaceae bacterium]
MEQFLSQNAIYVVMIIVLIVWVGIFGYLFSLDKRIKKVEKEMIGEKK